jgi:hypothetical protein
MATPFSAADLVSLPSMSAGELLSLMRQLLTEASALQDMLPPYVLKSRDRLNQALSELDIAYGAVPPSPTKRAADSKMDNAWRAFERFLSAAMLLQPHHSPGAKEAAELYALIFGKEGLRFITFIPELEYEETKKRLNLLEKSNLTGELNAMGGSLFVQDLQKTFVEYGEALHITTSRPQDVPAIRPLWEKADEAIRQYVSKVVSLEDPDDAGSLEQIKKLLKPLKEWEEKARASRAAAVSTEPAPPPADPTTPGTPDPKP